MPDYAKIMKDRVTKKRSLCFEYDDQVQHCSGIGTKSIIQKKKDLVTFIIPCTIGLFHFSKALCDLVKA